MKIKNIIFDFGGVLVDWNPRYLYKSLFKNPSEMEYFLTHICSDEWNLQQDKGRLLMEGTKILQKKFPDYHDKIQLFYDQWEVMLKDQIIENVRLLTPLKNNYQLYGLTNWSAETFPIALKRFSFFQEFDGIVVSGKEKMIKPEKDIFLLLLKRYQIKAEESIFIDDNILNIETAKTLKFNTIHVHDKMNLSKELESLNII